MTMDYDIRITPSLLSKLSREEWMVPDRKDPSTNVPVRVLKSEGASAANNSKASRKWLFPVELSNGFTISRATLYSDDGEVLHKWGKENSKHAPKGAEYTVWKFWCDDRKVHKTITTLQRTRDKKSLLRLVLRVVVHDAKTGAREEHDLPFFRCPTSATQYMRPVKRVKRKRSSNGKDDDDDDEPQVAKAPAASNFWKRLKVERKSREKKEEFATPLRPRSMRTSARRAKLNNKKMMEEEWDSKQEEEEEEDQSTVSDADFTNSVTEDSDQSDHAMEDEDDDSDWAPSYVNTPEKRPVRATTSHIPSLPSRRGQHVAVNGRGDQFFTGARHMRASSSSSSHTRSPRGIFKNLRVDVTRGDMMSTDAFPAGYGLMHGMRLPATPLQTPPLGLTQHSSAAAAPLMSPVVSREEALAQLQSDMQNWDNYHMEDDLIDAQLELGDFASKVAPLDTPPNVDDPFNLDELTPMVF